MILDGKKARITGIKDVYAPEGIEVYNLEVKGYENYIVENGVVVHNSNLPVETSNKYLVGDVVEFVRDGKTYRGTVTEIRNGNYYSLKLYSESSEDLDFRESFRLAFGGGFNGKELRLIERPMLYEGDSVRFQLENGEIINGRIVSGVSKDSALVMFEDGFEREVR